MAVFLLATAAAVNWASGRGEVQVGRQALSSFPETLGKWSQRGAEIRWDKGIEAVLGATDYTMREYTDPDGRLANVYIGYYASQRTGATYHSPQNCLPGAGWVLKEPQRVEITTKDGKTFLANQYLIENGIYREVMIYWYQGRGRIEASEYRDKLNTIYDSVTRRRTDAAMVRIMATIGDNEEAAVANTRDLAARTAENLAPYIPE